jgi:hypothetical protein
LTHKANEKLIKADVNHEKLLSRGFLIEQLQNWTGQKHEKTPLPSIHCVPKAEGESRNRRRRNK